MYFVSFYGTSYRWVLLCRKSCISGWRWLKPPLPFVIPNVIFIIWFPKHYSIHLHFWKEQCLLWLFVGTSWVEALSFWQLVSAKLLKSPTWTEAFPFKWKLTDCRTHISRQGWTRFRRSGRVISFKGGMGRAHKSSKVTWRCQHILQC